MKRLTPYILVTILACIAAIMCLAPYIKIYNDSAQFMDTNDLRLDGEHLGLACITSEITRERVCPDIVFTPVNTISQNTIYVVQVSKVVYIGNASNPASTDILKKPEVKLYQVSYQDNNVDWLPEPTKAAEEYLTVWCRYLSINEDITCSHTYPTLP